jgi:hypothetical protein
MNAELEELRRLMGNDEPLHPDLEEYLEETGPLGLPALRHPLVYEVPYHSSNMANRRYADKREAVSEALRTGHSYRYIYLHERPHRFDALQYLAYGKRVPKDIGELIADVWTDSENIWQNQDQWLDLIEYLGDVSHFFKDEADAAAYEALPHHVLVYRGCNDLNHEGMSWSTDYEQAKWFATRLSPKNPVVLHGIVAKPFILGYGNKRGENEVIASPENVIVGKVEVI